MSRIFDCVDAIEPIADTLGEMWGSSAQYNTISGTGPTYDAADMTVDLAAGAIMHNGSPVEVSALANAWTVISDPTNPRWTWLALSSAGAAQVVSGTPAATPAIPELGDRVPVALLLVQAGQTISANITYRPDQRIPNPQGLIGYSGTATSTTSTSVVALLTIAKLGFEDSIPITQPLRIMWQVRKTAAAAQSVSFGITINATTVYEVNTVTQWASSGTQRAEDGWCEIVIRPRAANYTQGFYTMGQWRVSADGASAVAPAIAGASATAAMPSAAITSVGIRAINNTSSNAAEVGAVFIYATL